MVVEGNSDTASATRKVFTGSHMITGDITPPGASLRDATTIYKNQLDLPFSGGWRFVALNTTKKPFDDINVRRATLAGLDKTALRQARGGPTIGAIAYHFIPPQFPGYEESGGASSQYDFMASPTANPVVSAKYFRAAGFPSGKYTGPSKHITLTCDNVDPGKSVCIVTADELRGMGFDPAIQSVPHEKMISICGIPAKEPEVCPNVGWIKDFYDPQTLLQATFSGKAILAENNSNYPQLNDPKINAMLDRAATLKDQAARVRAFAEINKAIVASAGALPFVWDKQPDAESKDVARSDQLVQLDVRPLVHLVEVTVRQLTIVYVLDGYDAARDREAPTRRRGRGHAGPRPARPPPPQDPGARRSLWVVLKGGGRPALHPVGGVAADCDPGTRSRRRPRPPQSGGAHRGRCRALPPLRVCGGRARRRARRARHVP